MMWIYFSAFMTTVVPSCLTPENIKYCYRIDEWLIPEIIHGWEVMNQPESIYSEEREYIEKTPAPRSK